MKKYRSAETCLVIATALVIFGYLYEINILFLIAIIIGIIGIIIKPLAQIIDWLWYKLVDILGYFMPKILLSFIFYFLLFPISLLSKIFTKSSLQLKKNPKSYWFDRNHEYNADDLKNMF